jgi:hypothetical protein
MERMQPISTLLCPVCKTHQPVSEEGRELTFSDHVDGEESCLGSRRNFLDAESIAEQSIIFSKARGVYPRQPDRRRKA